MNPKLLAFMNEPTIEMTRYEVIALQVFLEVRKEPDAIKCPEDAVISAALDMAENFVARLLKEKEESEKALTGE